MSQAISEAVEEIILDDLEPENAVPTRCAFLTGLAGTGKTYHVREKIAADPAEGVLCATTGIAAVNLGTITINSLLKYYDTDSLTNAFISGRLTSRLAALAKKFRNLYVDEVSMMAAEQLDVLYQAVGEANRQKGVVKVRPEGLGIVIVGDLCQLPPIKARWIFEADCWNEFETNTTRLTHNWRQGEGVFLDALNLLRSGNGIEGAAALSATLATFTNALDLNFAGTTIMSKNDEVDRYNWNALRNVIGEKFRVLSARWYEPQPDARYAPNEWKNIPESLELKIGAYVMILANARANGSENLEYANGDCGWVVARNSEAISVKLARNEKVVNVVPISRHATTTEYDEKRCAPVPSWGKPYFDEKSERYVIGSVRYMPLRLAWASTVHKCVSYGTRIAVQGRGVIPIEQAQIGDWIDTGTGEFARLKATAHTEKLLYRITTAAGYSVVSSADHRWKTTEGMKEAVKVVVGDLLQLAPPTIVDGTQAIDKETAWWIGATVGDANYSDRREGQIHFSGVVEFLRNRWMKTAQRLGGKPNTRRDERGCHLTSLPLRLRLEMWGLDYVTSLSKRTPMVVFESGRVAWAAYLQGLFDTDGGIDNHRLVYCTRSPFLADDVQYLLLLLGIPSSRGTYTADYHGTEIEYYHVRITAAGLNRFKALIGFSSPEKATLLAAWKPNRILRKFDGTDTVATIVPLGVIGPVIDVELETVHELGFNGIVGSNSQGLTLDRVQLDLRNAFFGKPAMAYVAVSRCREAGGLRIVGSEKLLAQRCAIDPKAARWV